MAVTRGPDAPEAEAAPASGTHPWKRITAICAAIAGVLAVLASLTSLFDWFEERVGPEPAPPTIDARLQAVGLKSRHEPLGEYLKDTNQSTRGLTRAQLREPGLVFTVRVRLEGGVGREYPLLWTVYDMRGGAAVSDDLYEQQAATFTPEAVTHARTWPVWVPYPGRPGRYRLDFVLQDEQRQPVDERSSRPFTVTTVPEVN